MCELNVNVRVDFVKLFCKIFINIIIFSRQSIRSTIFKILQENQFNLLLSLNGNFFLN